MIGAALAGALISACAHAQGPVTERQAATYIRGGFLTDSAHGILSRDVRLGPELQRRLAVPPGTDSRAIYEALVALTDPGKLVVRKASPEELSRYAAGGLQQPLFALESGDTTLLIQYDLQANNIAFVDQLAGSMEPIVVKKPKPVVAPEPPKALVIPPDPPKPVAAPAPPAPVVIRKPPATPAPPPQPVAAPVPPKPLAVQPPPRPVAVPKPAPPPAPRVEPLKPDGPCVVKPVMSNQDLVNCGATPR